MNISTLNAPATPPYDYHNHTNDNHKHFYCQQDQIESRSDNETVTSSAFRRVSPMSMPSPPELLIDSSEDEDEYTAPTYINTSSISPHIMHQKRKSVPHRSPSIIADHNSVVFQINTNNQPKVLGGSGGVLWSLRKRVSMARHQKYSKNRLSAPRPERRVRAMRIQIPRPQWSRDNNTLYDDLVSPVNNDWQSKKPIVVVSTAEQTWQKSLISNAPMTHQQPHPQHSEQTRKKSTAVAAATPRRKNSSHHASSGRPSRVKGPCQACHETSDGCMRKAFNWPFPTSAIFNDKGKPFVYLCNKCGLRYNKSGGCVCRHCRWVLCKEEKRKAMQLIDQMRRSRPDGRVDPDEDIENFACTPKYWSCGRPWKVGWVLHSQHDDEDDDSAISPSLSEATL